MDSVSTSRESEKTTQLGEAESLKLRIDALGTHLKDIESQKEIAEEELRKLRLQDVQNQSQIEKLQLEKESLESSNR